MMANTVKDAAKTEWEKVQQTGNERLKRIQIILKAAASETFDELKNGSVEIQEISRQSLAEMLAQAKARETDTIAEQDVVVVESMADLSEENEAALVADAASETTTEVPTWRQIFVDFVGLVNNRKGEWTEQVLATLKVQLAKFDTDMEAEYGERYRPFKKLVSWLQALVEMAYGRVSNKVQQAEAKPVQVEVLDDEATTSTTVEGSSAQAV
jgi:hypothetical protein